MTKQQLREYVQRWFDCYDTEWGGDADGDSSKALSEVLACLADEPRGNGEVRMADVPAPVFVETAPARKPSHCMECGQPLPESRSSP